ncbi:Thiol S-methyltransferase TMT1B [Cladobotryum mycophilum]|uniref:Thiol S-methyltransferase TMT1B n=1 Tax=Cladobotryum mycophilum TaxID=491253 RepID=A0ABR0SJI3_9HYPO
MPTISTLRDLSLSLTEPWFFLFYSLTHIPATIRQLIKEKQYGTLLSLSAFHDALFGTFWATVGPMVKSTGEMRVIPLLGGRVKDGLIHDEVVSPPIQGTVIEIGAGSGMWADVLARFSGGDDNSGIRNRKNASSGITKIYGIEPNAISAKALQERVKEVGLGDIYQVVPVGIESVDDPSAWNGKIEPGSVDSIVGVLCLCSIPEPEKNIKLLYRLLKPGGTWYVYEHVKANRGGLLTSAYQQFVNLFWRIPFGSCRLCRDTERYLWNAGEWKEFNIAQPPDEPSYAVCPHIIGTVTK